jgi:hypothetical protein
MADRYNAFIVILEGDIRDENAQRTIEAIKHIKGVLDVKPHVASFEDSIAHARVRQELITKIWKVVEEG